MCWTPASGCIHIRIDHDPQTTGQRATLAHLFFSEPTWICRCPQWEGTPNRFQIIHGWIVRYKPAIGVSLMEPQLDPAARCWGQVKVEHLQLNARTARMASPRCRLRRAFIGAMFDLMLWVAVGFLFAAFMMNDLWCPQVSGCVWDLTLFGWIWVKIKATFGHFLVTWVPGPLMSRPLFLPPHQRFVRLIFDRSSWNWMFEYVRFQWVSSLPVSILKLCARGKLKARRWVAGESAKHMTVWSFCKGCVLFPLPFYHVLSLDIDLHRQITLSSCCNGMIKSQSRPTDFWPILLEYQSTI